MKPMEGAESYMELYKIPREYDPEPNREEITWTEGPILAGYRAGLIHPLKVIGILDAPRYDIVRHGSISNESALSRVFRHTYLSAPLWAVTALAEVF